MPDFTEFCFSSITLEVTFPLSIEHDFRNVYFIYKNNQDDKHPFNLLYKELFILWVNIMIT